jgi:hypothetical protein
MSGVSITGQPLIVAPHLVVDFWQHAVRLGLNEDSAVPTVVHGSPGTEKRYEIQTKVKRCIPTCPTVLRAAD